MAATKRLFLLDGMPLLYRGHFIFMRNPRITSKGQNTSAVYGFANSILQIIETEVPTHIAVVFDTPEPTFRHKEFPEYKATRDAMPEDIAWAIPVAKELAGALNVQVLACPGYEADDVIGTLATKAEAEGFETFMVTPDKDFAQLVSDKTFLYKPGKGSGAPEIMGPAEVCERWGLQETAQVIDMLGLAGDATDNIPGVPGIGEKTAVKLLQEFGSLEAVLAQTDRLKGKQKEKVEANADQARLSKRLATIMCEAPVDIALDKLVLQPHDQEKLQTMLRELEFQSLGKRLLGNAFSLASGELALGPIDGEASKASEDTPGDGAVADGLVTIGEVPHDYRLAKTKAERKALIDRLGKNPSFCFDTETTSLDPRTTGIVGLSFCDTPGEAFYVPFPEDRETALGMLDEFRSLFEDARIGKTGHNLKFDVGVLHSHGMPVAGEMFDTMLAHYVIEPEQRHGMDHLARTFLRYSPISIETLIGPKGKDQKSIREAPVDKVAEYAAEDADVTLRLKEILEAKVAESGAKRALDACENPLIPVLVAMESEGISLDVAVLEEYSEVLARDIAELEKAIYKEAGLTFNIASPKQLGQVLFDHLKVEEKAKKTKTGQYKTDEEVLTRLATEHRIAELVLEFRNCGKLKSTYVDTLPLAVEDGRVHTTYNQAVTATGRMQSQHPNLQNIPIRTERGREIRKAFVPRGKGYLLMSADYSQIELRVMAELSGDEALRETFEKGHDVHAATAARVNGVTLENVTQDMRRQAKMVNFGIIYGISAFGLAQRLRIGRGEASSIIEAYFAQYPQVRAYMDSTIESAKQNGYVTTLMGRRRNLPDINSRNAATRQASERNAINTPIQGTAADMIKIAMIRIDAEIRAAALNSRMLLQVHDELVFDMYASEEEQLGHIVEQAMKTAIPMAVPIIVDTGKGRNWLEAH